MRRFGWAVECGHIEFCAGSRMDDLGLCGGVGGGELCWGEKDGSHLDPLCAWVRAGYGGGQVADLSDQMYDQHHSFGLWGGIELVNGKAPGIG
jgi:hypothetical protein